MKPLPPTGVREKRRWLRMLAGLFGIRMNVIIEWQGQKREPCEYTVKFDKPSGG